MGGEALPQAPRLSIPAASLAPSKARLDWCVRIGRVPMPSVGSGSGTTPNGGGGEERFPEPRSRRGAVERGNGSRARRMTSLCPGDRVRYSCTRPRACRQSAS